MKSHLDTWILAALTLVTAGLAIVMAILGKASWLEAASFVTGALCVWLTVKESVWNFPVSLVNVTTFSVVFYRAHLYADASLQVIYFILTVVGWYLWLYGGERRTALRIASTRPGEAAGVAIGILLVTAAFLHVLTHVPGAASPMDALGRLSAFDWRMFQQGLLTASFWDALTTALSLGAQWLLNRKRLETWILWITVDVIYIPLYLYKSLYLTAILYGVFLIMAVMGLIQWRATYHRQRTHAASGLPAAPSEGAA